MRSKKRKFYVVFICLICFAFRSYSDIPRSRSKEAFTRLGIAPVVGFYSLQTKHAIAPKSRMSLSVFAKREWSMDRSNKTFFSIGIEYFFHGLNYRSYYFDQDTLQIYDESFGYTYRIYMNELQLPIQAKFAFNSTTNSLFSPYATIGYHLRYLVSNSLRVEQDGNLAKTDFVEMQFKNPLFTSKLNSSVGIAFGFQSNRTRSNATTFFLEVAYRYGFSPYYFRESYSASSVFINSSHLSLNIGVGF